MLLELISIDLNSSENFCISILKIINDVAPSIYELYIQRSIEGEVKKTKTISRLKSKNKIDENNSRPIKKLSLKRELNQVSGF